MSGLEDGHNGPSRRARRRRNATPAAPLRRPSQGRTVGPCAALRRWRAGTPHGGADRVRRPEHLLLASVQACFLFTLRAVARQSKMEFLALQLDASGTVDRQKGAMRFTEIVLRPRLTVRSGTDRERALHVLEKSEKACLVSASLSTPIRLEPEITEHE
jgi:organic hydroperoxide reductase OsmC/OhrA